MCPWPSSRGTDLPRRIGGCDSRRTLFCPVMELVCQPVCRTGETGSIPVQGADRSGRSRMARQPSDTRCKAGSIPAGPTSQAKWPGNGLVEQPGVLAALTSRRPMVRIHPRLLSDPPSSPSGHGTSLTWRGPQVRVLPRALRSGLEPGPQHGLISRTTPVQIRPPQLSRGLPRAHRDRPPQRGSPGGARGSLRARGKPQFSFAEQTRPDGTRSLNRQ